MSLLKKVSGGLVLMAGMGLSASAFACPAAVNLSGAQAAGLFVQFGDGISFALPTLDINVQSSPGQISDCIVVATGAGGSVANNANPTTMDNAYENQQGDQFPYFRTGDPINNPDPSGAGQFTNDSASTWDIRLSALNTFLQGTSPVFYFNHNQTGAAGGGGFASTEDLFVWAQIILRNDAGAVIAVYDFTSVAPNNFGTPGGNVGSYNSPGLATSTNPTTGAAAGFPDIDDFVHARGKICFDGPHGVATSNIIPCDANQDGQADAGVVDIVDMNLGANNVANAIIFPELNAFLAAGAGGATVMQIDFRMGCNASIQPCPAGSVLNNGFEQLFIVAGVTTTTVPEPGTLALAGLLLLGMVGISRHRRQR